MPISESKQNQDLRQMARPPASSRLDPSSPALTRCPVCQGRGTGPGGGARALRPPEAGAEARELLPPSSPS